MVVIGAQVEQVPALGDHGAGPPEGVGEVSHLGADDLPDGGAQAPGAPRVGRALGPDDGAERRTHLVVLDEPDADAGAFKGDGATGKEVERRIACELVAPHRGVHVQHVDGRTREGLRRPRLRPRPDRAVGEDAPSVARGVCDRGEGA